MNSEVRKISIENRSKISAQKRVELNEIIYNKVINSKEYKEADVVFSGYNFINHF